MSSRGDVTEKETVSGEIRCVGAWLQTRGFSSVRGFDISHLTLRCLWTICHRSLIQAPLEDAKFFELLFRQQTGKVSYLHQFPDLLLIFFFLHILNDQTRIRVEKAVALRPRRVIR